MGAPKKSEVDISDKLQHIPTEYDYEPEERMGYADLRDWFMEDCARFRYSVPKPSPWHVTVNWNFEQFSTQMDENGMDKFVFMVSGTLLEIRKNDLDPNLIYGTMYDIRDFQTGEYDDLFTEEDLVEIRKDIAIIEEYAATHPELYHWLLNDGVEAEELARTGFKP